MHYSTILGAAAALAGVASASPLNRRVNFVGQKVMQCTQPGLVALTYDDGPFAYTSQLLDLLAANNAKATFFVNANNWGSIYDYADVITRMHSEGHHVGSHTGTHPDLQTLSTADRQAQMKQVEDATQSIAGFKPRYMRAPFLSCEQDCLADLGALNYVIVDTSLDTKDYEHTQDIDFSVNKFESELGDPSVNSYIVLAHDVHQTTVNPLTQKMLDALRGKGFRAVTVGECLGEPQAAWYQ
ncbi:polysaccharide deacetylase [Colletotrichum karsti]|uniref:Polysaccharide deacetylase n=1 Tax=Colletotrichum karsti TaxID=1095194 RepID=A0A9P6IFQ6_9PEZI|nr:polysaccharide deacetylase [Colletotrichum karsti]KAF9877870.1 polysaccharide deacetylase [Colletotrichum karsti]